ncbi:MFS general substrate transporter [Artomyces pyxidatus]|uniref:MFS general substrate transporter n=1 Tax=Artomyces pyxidatus TaxID=48021 RepID=A0ACB8T2M2_9AGAM|nr:MFS general substrate transporter [Artomyces pyxidatus]
MASHPSSPHPDRNQPATGRSSPAPSLTATLRDEEYSSHPTLPPSHIARSPDLSYPYQTTDVLRTGITDEYREVSESGVIPLAGALRRAPSRAAHAPPFSSSDPEKGKKRTDVQLVVFKPHDPDDPRNWSKLYKWTVTAIVALAVVSVAFGSAIMTGDFHDVEDEFGVSQVVVALTVSLMVVGFGLGPLVWAPLSEMYGRRPLWIYPFWLYVIFNIPCALAPNIGALLSCRFLCGFFASTALTLAGGAISDIWDNNERGFAIALFAAAPYGGPVLAPIVGGFVGETIGWRWMLWVNMIFAGVMAVALTAIPETYAPVILRHRAESIRKETGLDIYKTEQEMFARPFADLLIETLVRPFEMLVTEPILLLMSLYVAMIYGLLYAFFFSFPIIFGEGYGFNDGLTGLTFCSVLVGLGIALLVTPWLESLYMKQVQQKGKADPEDRLPGMMLGAPFVPISLFIFGWTSPPIVEAVGGRWIGPCLAGVPFGFGMVVLYFSANAYLIDTFSSHVASALAAKTVVRSGMGAAMPLFIVPMYHNLGNEWAASLLGFLSLAILPIPYLFYFYGKSIRARSKRASIA